MCGNYISVNGFPTCIDHVFEYRHYVIYSWSNTPIKNLVKFLAINSKFITFLQTYLNGTMRGSKLHSAFVRRREIEQIKIDKSAAVDKYFDKWGKITSRFEQWTAPEFYKQADEVNKQRELDKIKNQSLENRREKLKKLLDDDKCEQEMCLKGMLTVNEYPFRIQKNFSHLFF